MSDDFKARAANDRSTIPRTYPGAIQSSAPPPNRRGAGEDGEEGSGTGKRGKASASARAAAGDVIDDIFGEFSRLQDMNKDGDWHVLQKKIMGNARVLITAGLIDFKNLVSTSIEIAQFRKSIKGGLGSDDMPGDKLAEWLSAQEPIQ
jgi:hypothetical protein